MTDCILCDCGGSMKEDSVVMPAVVNDSSVVALEGDEMCLEVARWARGESLCVTLLLVAEVLLVLFVLIRRDGDL
jgi:hypothetical protein